MPRLRRLEDYQWVGTRDDMRVYDTDDADQAAELERRLAEDRLLELGLVQTFAPDTLPEARNRGFWPRMQQAEN